MAQDSSIEACTRSSKSQVQYVPEWPSNHASRKIAIDNKLCNLINSNFNKVGSKEIADNPVDLIFTVPPYEGKYLPIYDVLGKLAYRTLGLYSKPFQEIRDCALNLDRGRIKGIVSLDDKVIVDMSKDNGNGIDMKPKLTNNSDQNNYYKEIFPTGFVDLFATKNTTLLNNWEKPEEFKNSPIYHKAVEQCDSVIIDTNNLSPGNHTLKYIVDSVEGNPLLMLQIKDGNLFQLRNISSRSNKIFSSENFPQKFQPVLKEVEHFYQEMI